jgi:endonuclease/exonuclease/phosphatase family metal-dependent hydrolase
MRIWVSVYSYNLLSTDLTSTEYYDKCDPEHLKIENRWSIVKQRLTVEMKKNTIITLQELSNDWLSLLTPFFQQNNYYFVYDSQYLGSGIAFPNSIYSLEVSSIIKVGEELRKICRPIQSTYLKRSRNYLSSFIYTRDSYMNDSHVNDSWSRSIKKCNHIVYVKLYHPSSGVKFYVFVYHMPSAFRDPSLMHIHAAMLLKIVKSYSNDKPHILLGDFNTKPGDSVYRAITEGGNFADMFEKSTSHITPNLDIFSHKLRSAYMTYLESEPAFTNSSHVKGSNRFLECIDYIFISSEWDVVGVLSTPGIPDSQSYTNKNEPSDHVPIGASLILNDPIPIV